MKKSELYKTVRTEVEGILTESKVAKNVTEKVLNVIDTYLEPKKGGVTINLEDVVLRNKEGVITYIQDSISGVFLPATIEYFYEAKTGGIKVNDIALRRHSRAAEKIRKEFEKTLKASEKAIMQDVLDGKLKPEEGKVKIEALRAKKPDYSAIAKLEGAIVKK